ncbi:MAG: hypothetical protein JWO71_684 [Candidatus Acidoferrum typicum]|nr:hypothetical protein [Candidatus Acidoferrum typicum]
MFLSVAAGLLIPTLALTDQPSYDTVGAIEGEAISVQGPMNIEVVQGRTKTILRSGSDIHVNAGQARIDLVEGGQIAVCGPAHFSVLKSVNLLTLALDTGIIHARIEGQQPALTIYTAQIQAKPFAISEAPQDTLVGFDQTGAMCIRADSGAVRVEQQLTAQSIVIPQNGEVLITNGQLENLRSGVTHCSCELQLAKRMTSPPTQTEVSRLPTPEEMQKANKEAAAKSPPAQPKPAAKEGPVYQVFMPPLSYDATAKVQPDNFDPQLIVLVRRVRVRPTLIFQGTVKDAPSVAQNTPSATPPPPPAVPPPQAQQPQQKNPPASDSFISRIRAFFRSLFS